MAKKLLIIDHMCVLPYGHNLNAIILFKNELIKFYDEVICLVPKRLSIISEQRKEVNTELIFPYLGLISLTQSKFNEVFIRRIHKYARIILYKLIGKDLMMRKCTRNYKKIFEKYSISNGDTIFFPSADYYGVLSLIDYLETLDDACKPKVHVRLIGVAEGASYSMRSGLPEFFNKIRNCVKSGLNISISAETPVLANYASSVTNAKVTFFPYPLAEHSTIQNPPVRSVASPGQGRADKGYFRLYNIITIINNKSLEEFKFTVQPMRKSDPYYRPMYQSRIDAMDNVFVTQERISQEEINSIYAQHNIMLLPYDCNTYQLRGSAVYQESLGLKRLVVVTDGTGVSGLVGKYGNGISASTDEDFADAVIKLSKIDPDEREKIVGTAVIRYKNDFDKALKNLICDLK